MNEADHQRIEHHLLVILQVPDCEHDREVCGENPADPVPVQEAHCAQTKQHQGLYQENELSKLPGQGEQERTKEDCHQVNALASRLKPRHGEVATHTPELAEDERERK